MRFGFSGSSLAFTRTIIAIGDAFPFVLAMRHSAFSPTLEKAGVITSQKFNSCSRPAGLTTAIDWRESSSCTNSLYPARPGQRCVEAPVCLSTSKVRQAELESGVYELW